MEGNPMSNMEIQAQIGYQSALLDVTELIATELTVLRTALLRANPRAGATIRAQIDALQNLRWSITTKRRLIEPVQR